MRVERLEGEAPRFGVEPDPLQRAQAVAKRDQMGALRAVGPNAAAASSIVRPVSPCVRRLLQRGEHAGRRQIAVVRLRRLGGKVPERDRHLFAERIEHRDQALQQRPRQSGFQRNVDAGIERGARPLARRDRW